MSAINDLREAALPYRAEHTLEAHWKLFLGEGIGLVVLGVIALILPALASIGVALVLGWLLFLGGALGAVTTCVGRDAPGFWWTLLSSFVAMGAGILLFLWPAVGVWSLTLVLTVFLVADGVVTIMVAFAHRRATHQHWYWMLFNGALDLLFAAIILVALPASSFVVVGVVVGIDLVFGGATLVALTLAAHRTAES
ncbi:MAG: HdeD family acid-resistance protein [Rhizomicrobium sp.]|nr:HdeD family acid-resistance protein [Rhizomicrobium sp.]